MCSKRQMRFDARQTKDGRPCGYGCRYPSSLHPFSNCRSVMRVCARLTNVTGEPRSSRTHRPSRPTHPPSTHQHARTRAHIPVSHATNNLLLLSPSPIFSDDDSDTASLSRLRDAHLLTSPRGETPQIPFPIKKTAFYHPTRPVSMFTGRANVSQSLSQLMDTAPRRSRDRALVSGESPQWGGT